MTIDSNLPPKWQAVERLLEEVMPREQNPSTRDLLDDALTYMVMEAETLAVKQHGQQILDVLIGDRFQIVRDHDETDARWAKHATDPEADWKL